MGKESKEDDFSFDDFVFGDQTGEPEIEVEEEEVKDEAVEDSDEKDDEPAEDDTESDEEEDEDSDESDEDNDQQEDDADDDEAEGESEGFSSIIELMHEHNGWEFNEEDFKDKDSIEGLMEFVGEVISSNSKPEFASDEVQKFNDFVDKYGADRAGDYLKVNHEPTDYETVDLEDESNQKALMTDYLKKTTKFSEAKIAKQVKKAEELGELDEDIDEMKEFMIESKKSEAKALEESLAKEKLDRAEAEKTYLSNQKERIMKMDKIAEFDVSEKEREQLFDFTYKVGKDGKTEYQRLKEADKDIDVKLLFHAMKGLTKGKISKLSDSKAAKKLKKDLSRYKDNSAKPTSKAGAPKRSKKKSAGSDTNYNDFVF